MDALTIGGKWASHARGGEAQSVFVRFAFGTYWQLSRSLPRGSIDSLIDGTVPCPAWHETQCYTVSWLRVHFFGISCSPWKARIGCTAALGSCCTCTHACPVHKQGEQSYYIEQEI